MKFSEALEDYLEARERLDFERRKTPSSLHEVESSFEADMLKYYGEVLNEFFEPPKQHTKDSYIHFNSDGNSD